MFSLYFIDVRSEAQVSGDMRVGNATVETDEPMNGICKNNRSNDPRSFVIMEWQARPAVCLQLIQNIRKVYVLTITYISL